MFSQLHDDAKLFDNLYALVYHELPEINSEMVDLLTDPLKSASSSSELLYLEFNASTEESPYVSNISMATGDNKEKSIIRKQKFGYSHALNYHASNIPSKDKFPHETTALDNRSKDKYTMTSTEEERHNHLSMTKQDIHCSYIVETTDSSSLLMTGENAFHPISQSSLRTLPLTESKVDQPLRPLSAYNYFFRDERDRILNYGPSYDRDTLYLAHLSIQTLYTAEHEETLMRGYWNQDHTTKRKHRKTHGKISFTALSKMVSKRWKELSEEGKLFYQQIAAKDRERYQQEILVLMK